MGLMRHRFAASGVLALLVAAQMTFVPNCSVMAAEVNHEMLSTTLAESQLLDELVEQQQDPLDYSKHTHRRLSTNFGMLNAFTPGLVPLLSS